MRTTFDFSPLFRSSIGFDRLVNVLETASRIEQFDNWPSYDIAKMGDDDYRITMAVAGFVEDELSVTQDHNMLLIAGKKTSDEDCAYLHRDIAGSSFQRKFELADHVRVESATLANGLLTIDLKREVPEEMRPRRIEISTAKAPAQIAASQEATDKVAA